MRKFPHLGQETSHNLKQMQRLILSPQMQQALHLLQLPVLELSTVIADELECNPILEYAEEEECEEAEGEPDEVPAEERDDFSQADFEILRQIDDEFRDSTSEESSKGGREEEDLKAFLEGSLPYENSFFDHLMQQARDTFPDSDTLRLAEAILGNINDQGFLTTDLEEIAALNQCSLDALQAILQEIHTFEPLGVGARNLQESLLLQLKAKGKGETLAFRVVRDHFEEMLHNRIPLISKALRCKAPEIRQVIENEIALLNLHPGASYDDGHYKHLLQYVTPDVSIHHAGELLSVEVNEDSIPGLRLNQQYLKMLREESLPKETREYIEEKIASGKWLLRNIHERHHTLYRIAMEIVETQRDFLSQSQGKLSPLTMKSVAEKLELHESTIARAVANKYVSCGRGVLPLRSFFTHAYQTDSGENISSSTVKELVKAIVTGENRHAPLSDEVISSMIKEKGIPCARRTVAKYRQELGIGNTVQRKIHS